MSVASEINIFDPAFKANAFPIYARVRAGEPITRSYAPNGRPFWVCLGYDEGQAILKDHKRFANNWQNAYTPEEVQAFYDTEYAHLTDDEKEQRQATDMMFSQQLLSVDPPQHTRLRRLVSQSFTPKFVEGLRPRVQAIADELLDRMETHIATTGEREVDLLTHYAFPLPITVISEMLGVPSEDYERFRVWSNAVLELDPAGEMTEEGMATLGEFAFYLFQLIAKKRQQPANDLISGLIVAEEEGDKLNEQEMVGMIFILIVAGHETTVNLIGNGMLAFFEHPDQRAILAADPATQIKPAIEEILRFYGPVEMALGRYAMEDVEIGGVTIKRGEAVNVMIASADRDPEFVANPEVFDITRPATRHLGFGTGIHACLGAPLARMEGQIAIPSLLARFPDIQLAGSADDLVWRLTGITRGLTTLPVILR